MVAIVCTMYTLCQYRWFVCILFKLNAGLLRGGLLRGGLLIHLYGEYNVSCSLVTIATPREENGTLQVV